MHGKLLTLFTTTALILNCSGDLGDGPPSESSTTTAAGGAAASSTHTSTSGAGASGSSSGGASSNPMFETDIVPIFESSCGAGDRDCHRREAFGANPAEDCRGWASLEDASIGDEFYDGPDEGQPTGCPSMGLYERLLNIPGWTCGPPGASGEVTYLVVPCDPDASMLIQKIERPEEEQCLNSVGERGKQMPIGSDMDPTELDTLRRWIANGAPTLDNPNPDCGG